MSIGTDTESLGGLLKRTYSNDIVQNLQNMETVTFPSLSKSSRKPGGEGFYFPAHVQGNQRGQGSQNQNERLRDPGTQVVEQGSVTPKVFTHTIRYSGLSLEVAKGNEESFADNYTFQIDNGIKDSAKERNAQLYRDGSGTIAKVDGTQTSATILFKNGVPTHFREGMYLDFVTAGGTVEAASREVIDVSVANNTITLASSVTVTDNTRIGREGIFTSAPIDGKELAGLPIIADDGTLRSSFEGIVRVGADAVPKWRGFTSDMGGANVSNDLLMQAKQKMHVLSGTKPKVIYSNSSQYRKYLDISIPMLRYKKGDTIDSNISAEVPTWDGMTWNVDTDCGFGDIYMLDSDYAKIYEVMPLKLDDKGGVLKWDSGFDGYISIIKAYDNCGSENPRKGIRLTNLRVPAFG